VREQMHLLQQTGLQLEWHEFPKAHTIAGAAEIDLLRGFVTRCLPNTGLKS